MKDSKFKVDTKVGYTYEHIDFQFGAKGHPAPAAAAVRQALIQGMNRAQVAARSTVRSRRACRPCRASSTSRSSSRTRRTSPRGGSTRRR